MDAVLDYELFKANSINIINNKCYICTAPLDEEFPCQFDECENLMCEKCTGNCVKCDISLCDQCEILCKMCKLCYCPDCYNRTMCEECGNWHCNKCHIKCELDQNDKEGNELIDDNMLDSYEEDIDEIM